MEGPQRRSRRSLTDDYKVMRLILSRRAGLGRIPLPRSWACATPCCGGWSSGPCGKTSGPTLKSVLLICLKPLKPVLPSP